jgi:hypothetical protein
MTDVLSNLKEQLAAEEARAAAAAKAVADLRIAIRALEENRSAPAAPVCAPTAKRRSKRGEIMRVILKAVRNGKGETWQIDQACSDAGLELSPNSIANALGRLRRQIVWDHHRKCYLIRTEENNRAALIGALRASAEAEGSKAVALEPSDRDGAAGMQPLATALHTASN